MADQFKSNIVFGVTPSSKSEYLGHSWQTVVNPVSLNRVLQACDHCGVVKSENSITKACRGQSGARLLSSSVISRYRHAV